MFKPVNRHILVEMVDGEESPTPLIVLPEDFKPAMEKYAVVKVLNFADDIRFELKSAPRIVVDQSMIEEIVVNKTTYNVIQDNYVVGIVT
jgi:co-chaperonin GroES (HSP10)